MTSQRVLITGGSGFIGTNLVERFRRSAEATLSLDIAEPADPSHRPLWRPVDLLDREGIGDAVAEFQPTHVLHMGARTDLRSTEVADYAANTDGTRNLLEALGRCPSVTRTIVASTRMVCEIGYQPADEFDVGPTTAYGASKVETERLARDADPGIGVVIVRPCSIWGPWFGVPYFGFFNAVKRGFYAHPRGMLIHKSFGFVDNSVDQLENLLTAEPSAAVGRTFYLADDPLEVSDWAARIARLSGARRVREVPMGVLRAAAKAGDAARRLGASNPPLTSFRLANLTTEMIYDVAPLHAVAGPPATSLDDGIAATLRWMETRA